MHSSRVDLRYPCVSNCYANVIYNVYTFINYICRQKLACRGQLELCINNCKALMLNETARKISLEYENYMLHIYILRKNV